MSRHSRRHRRHGRHPQHRMPPGAAPGSLLIDPSAPFPRITALGFDRTDLVERAIENVEELPRLVERWSVVWINVDGLGDAATLHRLAEMFGIHPLALEDIVHVHQRAKVDSFEDRHLIVTHMVHYCPDKPPGEQLEFEQMSIVLGPRFVITFQERPGWDCLDPVRQRLRSYGSRVRHSGADYLAYELLDAVVDHNFPLLEVYGDRLDGLEERVVEGYEPRLLHELHAVKHELRQLRRTIWPQREAINSLVRDPIPQISDETRLHLRDTYDHCVRIIDLVENYRELCSDLTGLYQSAVANRTNEIMRVLTIISTLFIPLTFIAGVYGMNFHTDAGPWNMPELLHPYGYAACLGLMAAISIVQLAFFWRKGWIAQPQMFARTKREPS